MATETSVQTTDGGGINAWLSGLVGGLIGAIVAGVLIQFGFDPAILSQDLPRTIGMSGMAAGWGVLLFFGLVVGLVYAGIVTLDQLRGWAVRPNTGAGLGLIYGVVLWILYVVAMIGMMGMPSMGEYPLTTGSVLTFALVGLLVGIIYGMSPYTFE